MFKLWCCVLITALSWQLASSRYIGQPDYHSIHPYPAIPYSDYGYPYSGPAYYPPSPYYAPWYSPPGTYYDSVSRVHRPFAGGGVPLIVDFNKRCTNQYVGLKAHPEDPQYYYVCKPDSVIFGKCQNLQVFNATCGQCVQYPKPEYMLSCQSVGRFPIYPDCRTYYKCEKDLQPHIYCCPPRMIFSPGNQKCIDGNGCATTQISYSGSILPEYCKGKFPPCYQNGVFRSPADCSLYYKCEFKTSGKYLQTRLRCPEGNFYDKQQNKCLPKHKVPCDCIQVAELVYPKPNHLPYHHPPAYHSAFDIESLEENSYPIEKSKEDDDSAEDEKAARLVDIQSVSAGTAASTTEPHTTQSEQTAEIASTTETASATKIASTTVIASTTEPSTTKPPTTEPPTTKTPITKPPTTEPSTTKPPTTEPPTTKPPITEPHTTQSASTATTQPSENADETGITEMNIEGSGSDSDSENVQSSTNPEEKDIENEATVSSSTTVIEGSSTVNPTMAEPSTTSAASLITTTSSKGEIISTSTAVQPKLLSRSLTNDDPEQVPLATDTQIKDFKETLNTTPIPPKPTQEVPQTSTTPTDDFTSGSRSTRENKPIATSQTSTSTITQLPNIASTTRAVEERTPTTEASQLSSAKNDVVEETDEQSHLDSEAVTTQVPSVESNPAPGDINDGDDDGNQALLVSEIIQTPQETTKNPTAKTTENFRTNTATNSTEIPTTESTNDVSLDERDILDSEIVIGNSTKTSKNEEGNIDNNPSLTKESSPVSKADKLMLERFMLVNTTLKPTSLADAVTHTPTQEMADLNFVTVTTENPITRSTQKSSPNSKSFSDEISNTLDVMNQITTVAPLETLTTQGPAPAIIQNTTTTQLPVSDAKLGPTVDNNEDSIRDEDVHDILGFDLEIQDVKTPPSVITSTPDTTEKTTQISTTIDIRDSDIRESFTHTSTQKMADLNLITGTTENPISRSTQKSSPNSDEISNTLDVMNQITTVAPLETLTTRGTAPAIIQDATTTQLPVSETMLGPTVDNNEDSIREEDVHDILGSDLEIQDVKNPSSFITSTPDTSEKTTQISTTIDIRDSDIRESFTHTSTQKMADLNFITGTTEIPITRSTQKSSPNSFSDEISNTLDVMNQITSVAPLETLTTQGTAPAIIQDATTTQLPVSEAMLGSTVDNNEDSIREEDVHDILGSDLEIQDVKTPSSVITSTPDTSEKTTQISTTIASQTTDHPPTHPTTIITTQTPTVTPKDHANTSPIPTQHSLVGNLADEEFIPSSSADIRESFTDTPTQETATNMAFEGDERDILDSETVIGNSTQTSEQEEGNIDNNPSVTNDSSPVSKADNLMLEGFMLVKTTLKPTSLAEIRESFTHTSTQKMADLNFITGTTENPITRSTQNSSPNSKAFSDEISNTLDVMNQITTVAPLETLTTQGPAPAIIQNTTTTQLPVSEAMLGPTVDNNEDSIRDEDVHDILGSDLEIRDVKTPPSVITSTPDTTEKTTQISTTIDIRESDIRESFTHTSTQKMADLNFITGTTENPISRSTQKSSPNSEAFSDEISNTLHVMNQITTVAPLENLTTQGTAPAIIQDATTTQLPVSEAMLGPTVDNIEDSIREEHVHDILGSDLEIQDVKNPSSFITSTPDTSEKTTQISTTIASQTTDYPPTHPTTIITTQTPTVTPKDHANTSPIPARHSLVGNLADEEFIPSSSADIRESFTDTPTQETATNMAFEGDERDILDSETVIGNSTQTSEQEEGNIDNNPSVTNDSSNVSKADNLILEGFMLVKTTLKPTSLAEIRESFTHTSTQKMADLNFITGTTENPTTRSTQNSSPNSKAFSDEISNTLDIMNQITTVAPLETLTTQGPAPAIIQNTTTTQLPVSEAMLGPAVDNNEDSIRNEDVHDILGSDLEIRDVKTPPSVITSTPDTSEKTTQISTTIDIRESDIGKSFTHTSTQKIADLNFITGTTENPITRSTQKSSPNSFSDEISTTLDVMNQITTVAPLETLTTQGPSPTIIQNTPTTQLPVSEAMLGPTVDNNEDSIREEDVHDILGSNLEIQDVKTPSSVITSTPDTSEKTTQISTTIASQTTDYPPTHPTTIITTQTPTVTPKDHANTSPIPAQHSLVGNLADEEFIPASSADIRESFTDTPAQETATNMAFEGDERDILDSETVIDNSTQTSEQEEGNIDNNPSVTKESSPVSNADNLMLEGFMLVNTNLKPTSLADIRESLTHTSTQKMADLNFITGTTENPITRSTQKSSPNSFSDEISTTLDVMNQITTVAPLETLTTQGPAPTIIQNTPTTQLPVSEAMLGPTVDNNEDSITDENIHDILGSELEIQDVKTPPAVITSSPDSSEKTTQISTTIDIRESDIRESFTHTSTQKMADLNFITGTTENPRTISTQKSSPNSEAFSDEISNTLDVMNQITTIAPLETLTTQGPAPAIIQNTTTTQLPVSEAMLGPTVDNNDSIRDEDVHDILGSDLEIQDVKTPPSVITSTPDTSEKTTTITSQTTEYSPIRSTTITTVTPTVTPKYYTNTSPLPAPHSLVIKVREDEKQSSYNSQNKSLYFTLYTKPVINYNNTNNNNQTVTEPPRYKPNNGTIPRLVITAERAMDVHISICPSSCNKDHKHNYSSSGNRAVHLKWFPNNSNQTISFETSSDTKTEG